MIVRNLIFHITPMADWHWTVEELQNRLHIFNGKKIASVAQGPKLAPLTEVAEMLPGVALLPVVNDERIREASTLPALLRTIESTDPQEITFFGHSKGVTRGKDPAVRLWTEMMFHLNLDRLDLVDNLLKRFPVAGAFIRKGVFGNFPPGSKWHYSGTFWWFKNKELFSRKWDKVPRHRYGAEAYLSYLFDYTQAGVIFGTNVKSLYDFRVANALKEQYEAERNREAALKKQKEEASHRIFIGLNNDGEILFITEDIKANKLKADILLIYEKKGASPHYVLKEY